MEITIKKIEKNNYGIDIYLSDGISHRFGDLEILKRFAVRDLADVKPDDVCLYAVVKELLKQDAAMAGVATFSNKTYDVKVSKATVMATVK